MLLAVRAEGGNERCSLNNSFCIDFGPYLLHYNLWPRPLLIRDHRCQQREEKVAVLLASLNKYAHFRRVPESGEAFAEALAEYQKVLPEKRSEFWVFPVMQIYHVSHVNVANMTKKTCRITTVNEVIEQAWKVSYLVKHETAFTESMLQKLTMDNFEWTVNEARWKPADDYSFTEWQVLLIRGLLWSRQIQRRRRQVPGIDSDWWPGKRLEAKNQKIDCPLPKSVFRALLDLTGSRTRPDHRVYFPPTPSMDHFQFMLDAFRTFERFSDWARCSLPSKLRALQSPQQEMRSLLKIPTQRMQRSFRGQLLYILRSQKSRRLGKTQGELLAVAYLTHEMDGWMELYETGLREGKFQLNKLHHWSAYLDKCCSCCCLFQCCKR